MNDIPLKISAETMERAVRMAQYFLNSFDTLAPQIGMSDIPAAVAKVIELGGRQEKVTARDVVRRKWASNAKAAKELLHKPVLLLEESQPQRPTAPHGATMPIANIARPTNQ